MIDRTKMRNDISKGFKDGLDKVVDGAESVAKKAGDVSAEGQRKVKIFNLKRKFQGYMEDLGVAIHNAEVPTPGTVADEDVKAIPKQIKEANEELKALEKS